MYSHLLLHGYRVLSSKQRIQSERTQQILVFCMSLGQGGAYCCQHSRFHTFTETASDTLYSQLQQDCKLSRMCISITSLFITNKKKAWQLLHQQCHFTQTTYEDQHTDSPNILHPKVLLCRNHFWSVCPG